MPARQPDVVATRDRIVTASLELMRRNGYAGTGVKAILLASNAPVRFAVPPLPRWEGGARRRDDPRGRVRVPRARRVVLSRGCRRVRRGARVLRGRRRVRRVDRVRRRLPDRDDRGRDREHQRADAQCRRGRVRVLARGRWSGASPRPASNPQRARELAIEFFCSIEGAFLLSRTIRSAEPIRIAGRASARALGAELGTRSRSTRS